MSASELVKERAELLARVKQINEALELLSSPGAAVQINTRRNLRNTGVGYYRDDEFVDVVVYDDAEMIREASESDYGGWITAEDAAALKSANVIDGDFIGIVDN